MYKGLYQAHRGVASEFPENTVPAFRAAVIQGYDIIELDPNVTKDGVFVILHDDLIKRTLRKANGAPVPPELNVHDMTYAELIEYDAGCFMGERFCGVKVPTLEEMYKNSGNLKIKIDSKVFKKSFGKENTLRLFDEIKRLGEEKRTIFDVNNEDSLRFVLEYFPDIEINYDGPATEEDISKIASLCTEKNNLCIWLPMDVPMNSWVKNPFASDETVAIAHKYGRVGLWIFNDEKELELAERWHADVVETTGVIKPRKVLGGFVDCHTHTHYSHDSKAEPDEMYQSAVEKKLAGMAITDHFDLGNSHYSDDFDWLDASAEEGRKHRDSRPFTLCGVEIAEGMKDRQKYRLMTDKNHYDIINGSCHFVSIPGFSEYEISAIDFSAFTDEQLHEVFSTYLRNIASVIDFVPEINVVCHITYPVRYICGKHKRKISLDDFKNEIDTVLKLTVSHNLSLEVNTSMINSQYGNDFTPPESVLRRYYELGGRKVTLASDAHKPERVANGFEDAWKMLKNIGFDRLYYYKEGVAVPYVPYEDD